MSEDYLQFITITLSRHLILIAISLLPAARLSGHTPHIATKYQPLYHVFFRRLRWRTAATRTTSAIMIKTIAITVGYIASNWSAERISCGDPEASDTIECDLVLLLVNNGTRPTSLQADYVVSQRMASSISFWSDLSTRISPHFQNARHYPNGMHLHQAWRTLHHKVFLPGILVVSDESDCGEFLNTEGVYNGLYYMRHQIFDSTTNEYSAERVVIMLEKWPIVRLPLN